MPEHVIAIPHINENEPVELTQEAETLMANINLKKLNRPTANQLNPAPEKGTGAASNTAQTPTTGSACIPQNGTHVNR